VLIQHQREPQQEVKVTCPHCGKVAIKLQVAKILSVTGIPSPWN
jgi:Zn finger protein HypA/HybF involved in hydrogenase expression